MDQANFLGNINFEIGVVLQGPYMGQHFGWVSVPRRPMGAGRRPCLYMGAKIGHIKIEVWRRIVDAYLKAVASQIIRI